MSVTAYPSARMLNPVITETAPQSRPKATKIETGPGRAADRRLVSGHGIFASSPLIVREQKVRLLPGGRGGREGTAVTIADDEVRKGPLRRGFALEYMTLAWNVIGIVVLAIAALSARSVALAGFGLDSLIEIGASTVVIWELSGTGAERQRRGLRLIGYAFAALAVYLLAQSTVVLAAGYHPRHSVIGIIWTAVTAAAMYALGRVEASCADRRALMANPVLRTEGRVTMIDGILATAVLLGLILNAALGWWWADPAAGYVLVFYAARERTEIFFAPD